jgi:hypothetical protein
MQRYLHRQAQLLQEKFPEWDIQMWVDTIYRMQGPVTVGRKTNQVLRAQATHGERPAGNTSPRFAWVYPGNDKPIIQQAVRRLWEWLEEQER